MHLDPKLLNQIVLVLFLVVIFGSRMSKGSSVRTPEGLAFPMKLAFTIVRFVVLPLYYAFFFYAYWQRTHQFSWPVTGLFVIVMAVLISQAPGTIVLTETALEQRYWFLKKKVILYPEVMAIQKTQAGRSVVVLGDNRTRITHSPNHSDQAGFLVALEQRTGKKVTL